jgi:NAD(P)-dependent dehydrogenase (short-subunit alcohol dehydrogenase family)
MPRSRTVTEQVGRRSHTSRPDGSRRTHGAGELERHSATAGRQHIDLTHPLGSAADIAGAMLFLASPLAQWITGRSCSSNGGCGVV